MITVHANARTSRGILHVLAEYHPGDVVAYAITCMGKALSMADLSAAEATAVIGAADDARRELDRGPAVEPRGMEAPCAPEVEAS